MSGGHSAVEPPVTIPNTEVKCSDVDGSATYVCVRVDHRRASFFADMAQLVERTLGKGEVPSSTLGISTTHQILFPKVIYIYRILLNLIDNLFYIDQLVKIHPYKYIFNLP